MDLSIDLSEEKIKNHSKIKSLMWCGPKNIKLQSTDYPKIVTGSILIKVHACAICGSDLRIYNDGNPRIIAPQIIGHEIAGEIVEIGDGIYNFDVGDRVAIGADVPCGECNFCKSGNPNCCDINYAIGYQFSGGFTEYMLLDPLVVKYGPIKKFSRNLDYALAALAEPLACCINGYERGFIRSGSDIVIFGAGPIGVMLAKLASIYESTQVILIEPNDTRRQTAQRLLPNAITIDPKEVDAVKKVLQLTDNKGAELIFTACPVEETHMQAIKMVAKRGFVNFFGGLPKTAPDIMISSNWLHYREAYITGSHGSTPEQHCKALQLIESKKIDLQPLITHQYALVDILDAFKMAMSGMALKVVVRPHV